MPRSGHDKMDACTGAGSVSTRGSRPLREERGRDNGCIKDGATLVVHLFQFALSSHLLHLDKISVKSLQKFTQHALPLLLSLSARISQTHLLDTIPSHKTHQPNPHQTQDTHHHVEPVLVHHCVDRGLLAFPQEAVIGDHEPVQQHVLVSLQLLLLRAPAFIYHSLRTWVHVCPSRPGCLAGIHLHCLAG